jgi:hypothetical protein
MSRNSLGYEFEDHNVGFNSQMGQNMSRARCPGQLGHSLNLVFYGHKILFP